jgi:hypothetical protein
MTIPPLERARRLRRSPQISSWLGPGDSEGKSPECRPGLLHLFASQEMQNGAVGLHIVAGLWFVFAKLALEFVS